MLKNKNNAYLIISYLTRYFADALFFSFYQIYILSKGLTEDKLGIIVGIMPIIVILVNPLWNKTIKNINSNKKILQIMTLIEGILIIIFGKITTFEIFLIIISLIAILDQPFYGILDGYTTIFSNEYKIEFASIRKYGSIAYILGSFIGGILIKYCGYTTTFLISGILYFIPFITFKLIKPFEIKEKPQPEKKKKQNINKLIKNKKFITYAITYVIMFGTAYIAMNFFNPFLVKERGLPEYYSGYIKAYDVILEVLTILILTKFGKKIKDTTLYLIISIFYLSKILPIALNMPTSIIIICSGFHGIGFGSLLYIHYKHILELVSEEQTTTALLLISILNALYTSIGNILIGYAIKYHGYSNSFKILLLFSLSIVIIMIVKKLKENKERKIKHETI